MDDIDSGEQRKIIPTLCMRRSAWPQSILLWAGGIARLRDCAGHPGVLTVWKWYENDKTLVPRQHMQLFLDRPH